jgi:hypothetical protein
VSINGGRLALLFKEGGGLAVAGEWVGRRQSKMKVDVTG